MTTRSRFNTLLLGVAGILLVLLALTIVGTPSPQIDTEFSGARINISADRAWSIFPGDCLTLRWEVEGIKSIYIDGQGKIGWGEMAFCPTFDHVSPKIDITSQNGATRVFTLDIYLLPTELLISLLHSPIAIILDNVRAGAILCLDPSTGITSPPSATGASP